MAIKLREEFIPKRSEIFKEFTLYLAHTIIRLYPGRDALNDDKEITYYYDYCYNQTCDEFLKQGLDFKDNTKLAKYFYTYFYNELFTNGKMDFSVPKKLWTKLFNPLALTKSNIKTQTCFIELYSIFNNSIK